MPATEETYRSQAALHVVFGVSSLGMALVVVWMIMADHLRPWKTTQREFQQLEMAKLDATEKEKQARLEADSKDRLSELGRERQDLESLERTRYREVRDAQNRIDRAKGRFEKLDTQRRFMKAELDSQRSFYDGFIDRDERAAARRLLVETIVPLEQRYDRVSRQHEAANRALERAQQDRDLVGSRVVEVKTAPPPGTPAEAAGFRAGDVIAAEDFLALRREIERGLSQGQPARASVRVRRGDREVTVPVEARPPSGSRVRQAGAEAPEQEKTEAAWEDFGLDVTPVTREVLAKRIEDLRRDVENVKRTIQQKRERYGEGNIFYRMAGALRGLPIIDLAAPPTKIQQISLPDLTINYNFKDVPRYDRCTTCHLAIDKLGYDPDARVLKQGDGSYRFLSAADKGSDEYRRARPIPLVYRSHPFLNTGATTIDPKKGTPVPAGLYLDSNGPHPINNFGCTICHGGQGSGTSFTYASHEPNTLAQRDEWAKEHEWHNVHFWDEPMLPQRFMQSSCLKCHHQVTDVPQADKLQRGYQRITKFGCTGCHTIGGEGSTGPDLTDNRKTGPNLKHIGSKVTRDWTLRWVKNPHAFRPDTRMPRFYEVTNNTAPEDRPKVHAEVHAITHYLFANSAPPKSFVDPPAKGDAARGKDLFFQKGCLACHSHKEYGPETFAKLPDWAKKFAAANHGPNLSNMAAKFRDEKGKSDQARAFRWLANWIKAPESYHPKSLMPNLQLSWQEAADLASWVLSVPGEWPRPVDVPPVDDPEVRQGLDELVKLYLSKSKVYNQRTILLSEVDSTVAAMSQDEKLTYLGQKTIGRLGCFGCHDIAGFETAKPIGTPLSGWGFKSPSKLDFGHIAEYLGDHRSQKEVREGGHAKVEPDYDGTDEYYYEKLVEHTRQGFLYQKLHRPRSYDYAKTKEDLKSWDDRLRMPQFSWADEPEAIEEVMTFVLGLTGEKIPAKYLPRYKPATSAVAQGERLLERYNCRGCHVLEMPKYTIAAGTKVADALPDFQANVEAAYGERASDYLRQLYPKLSFKADSPPNLTPDDGRTEFTIEGMPTQTIEDEDEQGRPVRRVSVDVWRPTTIRGFTFNVGDKIVVDPARVRFTEPVGGDFAWLYSLAQSQRTGESAGPTWNRLPPPLVREGVKVQTPWLTGFLKDPYPIRPAVNLRMPRFHYGATPEELREEGVGGLESSTPSRARQDVQGEVSSLANFFAARDGAEFPYQDVPEQERAYLDGRESAHKNYLAGGWTIITKGLCVQCHAIGQYQPSGGAQVVNGPDLRQVSGRFRPDYLLEWLANPKRLLPYTAMPQNIPPTPPAGSPPPTNVPRSFEGKQFEQVRAMRDTLLNYVSAIERQLASGAKPESGGSEPAKAKSAGGGGRSGGQ